MRDYHREARDAAGRDIVGVQEHGKPYGIDDASDRDDQKLLDQDQKFLSLFHCIPPSVRPGYYTIIICDTGQLKTVVHNAVSVSAYPTNPYAKRTRQ